MIAFDRNANRPAYSPQIAALIDRYGEDRAYEIITAARLDPRSLSPDQRQILEGVDLRRADREVEGSIQGLSQVPLALAFEGIGKPIIQRLPEQLNAMLPNGWRNTPGVTSDPSWENVQAAARGAVAGGRVLPKVYEDWLKGAILEHLARRNGGR